jgi:hypothetical protein
MIKNYLPLFTLSLLLWGCSKPPIPYEQLSKALNDSTITPVLEHGPFKFRAQYLPDWFLAVRNLQRSGAMNENARLELDQLAAARAEENPTLTFVLTIAPGDHLLPHQKRQGDLVNHQPDQKTFSHYIHHYTYGMNDSIYLVVDDTHKVPVSRYQLDRNWGIGFENRFLFTFPSQTNEKPIAEAKKLELVVQNLRHDLPELRFEFVENPVKRFNHSNGFVLACLNLKDTES